MESVKPRSERILDRLDKETAIFFDIGLIDSAVSTNELIKDAIRTKAGSEGRLVVALQQSGGYGRQGRHWSSPPGGIYFSLLLHPLTSGRKLQEIPTLGLVFSLAVRAALAHLGSQQPISVKWPNDVVCSQGKLCGISLELVEEALCLGVGLNLFRPIAEEALEGKSTPAYAGEVVRENNLPQSVFPQGISTDQASFYEDVLAAVLSELRSRYSTWLEEGFSPFRDEYRAHHVLEGQQVRLVSQTNGILNEGVVQDLDTEGRLCLLDAKGVLFRANSGEVHLV